MFEPPEIAERIKEVIKIKKIGTLDMLKSCGLSKNALTTMVNGSMPKADSLAKIAAYLGVGVEYLMGIEKPATPEGEQPADSDTIILRKEVIQQAAQMNTEDLRQMVEYADFLRSKKKK